MQVLCLRAMACLHRITVETTVLRFLSIIYKIGLSNLCVDDLLLIYSELVAQNIPRNRTYLMATIHFHLYFYNFVKKMH